VHVSSRNLAAQSAGRRLSLKNRLRYEENQSVWTFF
jgi:hypothetical protein